MPNRIRTHLLFDGKAEEAMRFYVDLLPGSRVFGVQKYSDVANEGRLERGSFTLGGREYLCADTQVDDEHTFASATPVMSIFIDCESPAEIERLFKALSEGGEVRMPLDDYGFSTRFGYVTDRFGVSWQLNRP